MTDGHTGCRIQEFARWPRMMLEHEREYLSSVMANEGAFMGREAQAGILHDLTDIDWLLAELHPRIKTP
jgi:hypothetical protein